VKGQKPTSVPAGAVIAYSDTASGASDYDARTIVAPVQNGRFEIAIGSHKPGESELRLTATLLNGATQTVSYQYEAGKDGEPDISRMAARADLKSIEQLVFVGRKDQALAAAAKLLKESPNHRAAAQLKHLPLIYAPSKLVDLAETTAASVSLSNARPVNASTGYGPPARNHYLFSRRMRDAVFLSIDGVFHANGLYAHSRSSYEFQLAGKWKKFSTTAGLQDGAWGGVRFTVKGDGKVLHRTGAVKAGGARKFTIDVAGVKKLELVAESAAPRNSGCWSVWGSPQLSR